MSSVARMALIRPAVTSRWSSIGKTVCITFSRSAVYSRTELCSVGVELDVPSPSPCTQCTLICYSIGLRAASSSAQKTAKSKLKIL